jgi:hypothetical protein
MINKTYFLALFFCFALSQMSCSFGGKMDEQTTNRFNTLDKISHASHFYDAEIEVKLKDLRAKKGAAIADKVTEKIAGLRELGEHSDYKSEFFSALGGPNPDYPNAPFKYKDTDTAVRLFIEEGRGEKMKSNINAAINTALTIYDTQIERDELKIKMPLKNIDTKDWVEDTFRDKSAASIMEKFVFVQNDAQLSCLAILEYVSEK